MIRAVRKHGATALFLTFFTTFTILVLNSRFIASRATLDVCSLASRAFYGTQLQPVCYESVPMYTENIVSGKVAPMH